MRKQVVTDNNGKAKSHSYATNDEHDGSSERSAAVMLYPDSSSDWPTPGLSYMDLQKRQLRPFASKHSKVLSYDFLCSEIQACCEELKSEILQRDFMVMVLVTSTN